LDLEVNGATKLLSQNNHFIGIFIDIDDNELINRLKNRGHDNEFINKRMALATLQREKKSQYQYHVDNIDINTSVNQILDIIYSLEES
jgi:guanylate kinase